MSIENVDVQKIAWLARLTLNEQDVPNYRDELSNILKLVKRMNLVDTKNISPLAHPLEMSARLRPDEVTECNQREHFLKCSPLTKEGYYLVPKVIE